jgi:hypothetical protein
LYYHNKWSQRKAIGTVIIAALHIGGLEALLVLTLRIPYAKGVDAPILVMGILSAVLFTAGLVPPYWEIWKRRGRVIGIDWTFLSIDWTGALLSLLAVGKRQHNVMRQ